MGSEMDATDPEVLRTPSLVIAQILVRYGVRFSTALVPQLQLWHLHWLISEQSVGDRAFTCYEGATLRNRNTLASGWRWRRRSIPFPEHQYQLHCYTYQEHVTVFGVCASYDHTIATDPCYARVLGTPSTALCFIVTNDASDKYVIPFDDDVYLGNWVSQDTTCVPFSTCCSNNEPHTMLPWVKPLPLPLHEQFVKSWGSLFSVNYPFPKHKD
jgi:hypothetical protein